VTELTHCGIMADKLSSQLSFDVNWRMSDKWFVCENNSKHCITSCDSSRDLGVVVDSHLTLHSVHLTMTTHVSAVCPAAYYQLRQLRLLIRSLSFDAAMLLVQHSFQHAWTIATHYCAGSATTCTDTYKPFRMPQHASSST